MRRYSTFRHAVMAFAAYLAFGVVMANNLPPPKQPVADDREAVLLLTHRLTWYLGAEELAHKVMMLPAVFQEAASLSPAPLRRLIHRLFGSSEPVPSILGSPADAASAST